MRKKTLTYIIDDRRYIARELAAEKRLDPVRINEITGRIPDFRASIKMEDTKYGPHVLEVSGPNGKDVIAKSNALIESLTLPEIHAHFKGKPLPNGRNVPFSVIEIH